jgi:hypothetical protein
MQWNDVNSSDCVAGFGNAIAASENSAELPTFGQSGVSFMMALRCSGTKSLMSMFGFGRLGCFNVDMSAIINCSGADSMFSFTSPQPDSNVRIVLSHCLFDGNKYPGFIDQTSGHDIALYTIECLMDGSNTDSGHHLRNIEHYRRTLTFVIRHKNSCHFVAIDNELGTNTDPTGRLVDRCNDRDVKNNEKWNGITGEDAGHQIQFKKTGSECCSIRLCMFVDLTTDDDGGAVSLILSGKESLAGIIETQFAACRTAGRIDLQGGAVYAECRFFEAERSCGASCASHFGAFMASKTANSWLFLTGCTVYKCGRDKEEDMAIWTQNGHFRFEDTNFSDCKAGIVCQREYDAFAWSIGLQSHHITCYRCGGTCGFQLRLLGGAVHR